MALLLRFFGSNYIFILEIAMLTTKEIDHAKPQEKLYRLFDGLGLYIQIDPNGSKYWRFKYHYLGKEKRLSLGKYPDLTLLEAREKREQARKLLAQNIDPSAVKKEAKAAAPFRQTGRRELLCGFEYEFEQ